MRKSFKIILVLSLCVAICCCNTVFAMKIHGDIDEGECCAIDNCIKYEIEKFNATKTNEVRLSVKNGANDNVTTRTVKDYAVFGDTCDARWGKLIDPTEPLNSSYTSKLIIGEGIKVIGENAFRGQVKLATVDVASTVTEIKDSAFENCTSLATVNYYGTEEMWENMTIGTNNGVLNKTYTELITEGTLVDSYRILGDVNLDGSVDSDDVDKIADCSVGNIEEKTIKVSAADFNGDGDIDVCDCVKLLLATK